MSRTITAELKEAYMTPDARKQCTKSDTDRSQLRASVGNGIVVSADTSTTCKGNEEKERTIAGVRARCHRPTDSPPLPR